MTITEFKQKTCFSETKIRRLIATGELKAAKNLKFKGKGQKPWVINEASANKMIAKLNK